MPKPPAPPLELSPDERTELESMARSTSLQHRKVMQAKALLWAGDGVANEEIARRCATTPDTVRRWRTRFAEEGVAGVGSVRRVGFHRRQGTSADREAHQPLP